MSNQHPITPPLELVQQWLGIYFGTTVTGEVSGVELALATQAARWGQPAATPIPIAERLPGPEDLDREGTCWMFHPINLHYCLCVPDPSIHTYWLPANALPVPTNV